MGWPLVIGRGKVEVSEGMGETREVGGEESSLEAAGETEDEGVVLGRLDERAPPLDKVDET